MVSAPGSPATPFYFIVATKGDAYAISGEGNGQKSATKPAFEALAAMSPAAVAALYKEVLGAVNASAPVEPPPNK